MDTANVYPHVGQETLFATEWQANQDSIRKSHDGRLYGIPRRNVVRTVGIIAPKGDEPDLNLLRNITRKRLEQSVKILMDDLDMARFFNNMVVPVAP